MSDKVYEVAKVISLAMMWLAAAANVVGLVANLLSRKKWERMMNELQEAMVGFVASKLVEDLFAGDEQRIKDGDVDPEKVLNDAIEAWVVKDDSVNSEG